ncbi:phospho-N-acetylmuramoyl-pentapeptide-transferase [Dichelobacter nodosus]|uniref:Phospho-N-acetylmuramoyl-pentapeptide-transferase n=1 Tax=Dichelobacter nodosus (strain VCS1703A) TaxID=246195 RepID=MRAY_DICNV|nr:phospho-N-acetylmuramoyl-pentapeptide-transferase [Dichelobacter nodosus]A5EY06.1 RecName: Full=Phospho-N-acetylmuramoyl-pentapeptide-transferase; AltName: Full=UDP-MurNAc-pentapeptide phosphotransferase [Dichelobacter nodosus VCS1703A]ABQ13706.1 phospho-N-acetylmuramoyl-pentapeptide-transferase [Dichelobacter nodosus VCS1703A]AXM45770.1 phospho-N-acetylmuramoyl-pentapeptide-transferase [Dichelobacter nodosus]KNZ39224.1 phospho-N-acetylmuramoyl-pentapeptide-transferase [Dichelobacter nodosus
MLYALATGLSAIFTPLNALTYLTSRIILGALTALLLSIFCGGKMIRYLQKMQMGQFVRDDGPKTHLKKAGTPTMGGALIIFSITVSMLCWADLRSVYTWLALFVLLGFGAVGWTDDYLKLVKKNTKGLAAKQKYAYLSLVALLTALWLYFLADTPIETTLIMPFFKHFEWQMGILFIPFVYLVLTGASNAVNLTDGLDGLAIMPVVLVSGGLCIFAYLSGSANFALYLHIPAIAGAGEMAIFCAAIAGAGLGFLWYNAHPALVFMGDVGALSLGAALATVAVVVRQELAFAVMGGVFVAEALSVMIQVGSYKCRGKRVFRMAPLHHHFELGGWPESRVTIRFWIITVVLVLVGLSTLKLR